MVRSNTDLPFLALIIALRLAITAIHGRTWIDSRFIDVAGPLARRTAEPIEPMIHSR